MRFRLSHDSRDIRALLSLEAACSQHCSGDVQTTVLSRRRSRAFWATIYHGLVDFAPCEQGNHLAQSRYQQFRQCAPALHWTWCQRPTCRAAAAAAARETGPDGSALERGQGGSRYTRSWWPPAAVEQQPQCRNPGTHHCTSCGCGTLGVRMAPSYFHPASKAEAPIVRVSTACPRNRNKRVAVCQAPCCSQAPSNKD